MSEPEPVIDVTAVAAALRLYHAAQNAHGEALRRLREALPPGVVVLHKLPGEAATPTTLYWSYCRSADGLSWGVQRGEEDLGGQRRAVIVEAPPPRAERLRLALDLVEDNA